MTDEELERMRAYAQAAKKDQELPPWSLAYAQDVPQLLDEIANLTGALNQKAILQRAGTVVREELRAEVDRLTAALDQIVNDGSLKPIERGWIARDALAGVEHAEPMEHDRLWRRLRFAEMVLDRVNAEIDGVPWREAARLSESLDGEPVTDPLAPPLDTGVQS